ncbi:MAG: DEAD/DEAH box helicase [Bacillota bacterium]
MFTQFKLDPILLENIKRQGYEKPTPIQTASMPPALEGRDLVATAETGSGKTAAFLLPIMQKLMAEPRGRTRALILCPTREIALQTNEEAGKLGRGTGLRSASVYGGVGFEPQTKALRTGAEIIVATPGRLLDHMGRGNVNFRDLSVLILDEADRMLDMGFMPDIKRIISSLSQNRQTMLFSATMPSEILSLSNRFMKSPTRVSIGRPSTPPKTIDQAVYAAEQHEKTSLLLELIRAEDMDSVLVFTRTKHRADRLVKQLSQSGLRAACIHGDRSQHQREEALDGFRRGRYRILVATDIAARGLDIQGVTHVINYDLPPVPEDYIHRIGRTARAGASGKAISLATREDGEALRDIEMTLGCDLPLSDAVGLRTGARTGARPESRTTRPESRTARTESQHARPAAMAAQRAPRAPQQRASQQRTPERRAATWPDPKPASRPEPRTGSRTEPRRDSRPPRRDPRPAPRSPSRDGIPEYSNVGIQIH